MISRMWVFDWRVSGGDLRVHVERKAKTRIYVNPSRWLVDLMLEQMDLEDAFIGRRYVFIWAEAKPK